MMYRLMVGAAVLAMTPAVSLRAADDAAEADRSVDRSAIVVTGIRITAEPSGATTLPISILDTPQSVTVINRDYLDAFALDEANDALRLVTGVNVEKVETDRTYYNARGFDIKAAKVDGLGLPSLFGLATAQLDTSVFERIEVIRGANGLLSGTGNPSGTINYLRKRPRGQRKAYGELSAGSWSKVRVEADVEIPLAGNERWSLRASGAAQDNNSYLRDYEQQRTALQAILAGELTDRLALVAGYTRQDTYADSPLWGALPMLYTDGTPTDFPRSTSTAQDWAYWNTHDSTYFGELHWSIAETWTLVTSLTRKEFTEPSRLFYVYGTPDPVTGQGLFGFPARYDQRNDGWIADAEMIGKFEAFGQAHDLTIGAQYADSELTYLSYPADPLSPAWGALPPLPNWSGQEVPLPVFGAPMLSSDVDYRIWRIYGAARLSVTDALKLIGGFNYIDVKADGSSFDTDYGRREKELSPYVGITYEFAPQVNLYASYSDVFEPQSETGEDLTPLGPAKGESLEGGIKGNWLNGQLFAALAVYAAQQSNIPEVVGFQPPFGTLYRGIKVKSRGIELDLSGKLRQNLIIQGGIAHLFSLENDEGERVRTYTPRTTANLSLRWRVIPRLTLGTAIRWQDKISLETAFGTIRQGSYATVQLLGRYDISEQLAFSVNIGNATNRKYLNSLYWEQAYYAAPRNVTAALQWRM